MLGYASFLTEDSIPGVNFGNMIRSSDLPAGASLTQHATLPGAGLGCPALEKHIHRFWDLLREGQQHIQFNCATATGKSRIIPSATVEFFERANYYHFKLLVLTPSSVDVQGMQQWAHDKGHASGYFMGDDQHGGRSKERSKIVFATVGLVCKWYACKGERLWSRYDAVLFDEINQMEHDPGYASLYESARRCDKNLLIMGASATYSAAMEQKLGEQGASWIRCAERPYPTQQFVVEVPTFAEVYPAVNFLVKSLYDRNKTSLTFFPGKSEIVTSLLELKDKGVPPKHIVPFHSEVEPDQLEAAKDPTTYARCVLATSLAETSITLPDVDVVIDLGFSRSIHEYDELLQVVDFAATDAQKEQRRGRVGRRKSGASVLFRVLESRKKPQTCVCIDTLCRVVALEDWYQRILASELSLCPLSQTVLDEASRQLCDLNFTYAHLWAALVEVRLSLKDAAIFLKAHEHGVAYEAAAILAVKAKGQLTHHAIFSVDSIVELVEGTGKVGDARDSLGKVTVEGCGDPRVAGHSQQQDGVDASGKKKAAGVMIKRPFMARDLFNQLIANPPTSGWRDWYNAQPPLCRSTKCSNDISQCLALAFLVAPERLVKADLRNKEAACFLGAPLEGFEGDGYSVAILPHRYLVGKGYSVRCAMSLPCSEWVLGTSKLPLLTHTAQVHGDSTFVNFRKSICSALRLKGYDVKLWRCIGPMYSMEILFMCFVSFMYTVISCLVFFLAYIQRCRSLLRVQWDAFKLWFSCLVRRQKKVSMRLHSSYYGGAEEDELAVQVATSGFVNLKIVCPNGNRLSKHESVSDLVMEVENPPICKVGCRSRPSV